MNTLTPRAQQIMALANKASSRQNHSTEHILLGLIMLRCGTAIMILEKLGVDLEALRLETESRIGRGPEEPINIKRVYTPRTKKVLALASKEATALNHSYVGTEHILLGILRESEGIAANVLKGQGLTLKKVRDEFYTLLNPNYPAQEKTRAAEEIVRSLVDNARALCILHGLEFQSFLQIRAL
jgi:ATP-dependent Clp protease ATP-binding subunit ClpC